MTTTQSPAVEKKPEMAAAKKVVKPAAKPAAKPATKPAVKPVADAAAKTVVKAVPKVATKGAPKAASKVAAKTTKAAPAPAKPVVKPKAEKPPKARKPKLVRDSFTIPKPEYLVLDELKLRAGKLASPAKKTELIRAGIKALAAMSDTDFLKALKAVPAIKTGRPSAD